MDKKKTDRRVRRTKTRLTEGLLHLLMQKDIKDISVRELAEYADINRCTFYLHYKDIYDMIEKIEEELFQEFNEILDAADLSEDSLNPDPVLHNIFDCLYQNQTAVAAFLGPHGDRTFLNKIKKLLKERMYNIWEEHSYQIENFEYYNSFLRMYRNGGVLGAERIPEIAGRNGAAFHLYDFKRNGNFLHMK